MKSTIHRITRICSVIVIFASLASFSGCAICQPSYASNIDEDTTTVCLTCNNKAVKSVIKGETHVFRTNKFLKIK